MLEISITGIQSNQNRIKNVVSPEEVQRVLIRGGFKIEGDAKQRCPVDTGRLRSSISTNWNDSGMSRGHVESPAKAEDGATRPAKGNAMCVVRVATSVNYAEYIEYGTQRMGPQPYLEPAAMANIAFIKKELDDLFNKKAKQ